MNTIGAPISRADGRLKVTGRAASSTVPREDTMTDEQRRRLHAIERELAEMARGEVGEQAELLLHASGAVGGAAFGPALAVHYAAPPSDLPFKP